MDHDEDDASLSSQHVPATPSRVIPQPQQQQHGSPIVPPTPQEEIPSTPRHDHDDNSTPLTPISQTPPAQEPPSVVEQEEEMDETLVVRGTNVNVRTAAATFKSFLQTFRSVQHSARQQQNEGGDDDSVTDEEDEEEPLFYMEKLRQLVETQQQQQEMASLDLDTMHLYYHNTACQQLYHQLVAYPMEMVPLMDLVLQQMLQSDGHEGNIQVRPYHLKELSHLRRLDPSHQLDSLLCVQGFLVRSSPVIPDFKVAHMECTICGHVERTAVDRGRIQEPTRCNTCNCRNSFQLMHNQCVFADKQALRIQETPDQVPAGQTPASVLAFCFDDLVNAVQPGDRIELTGVLRAQPRRVHPKISKIHAVYKTYIDVIHVRRIHNSDNNRSATASRTGMVTRFTPERIQQLRELSEEPDIYDQLTRSLAPSIWEMDDVKRGILCMLFGGNHVRVKQKSDNDDGSDDDESEEQEEEEAHSALDKRGDVNILLCGDPGTSKSQLLSFVYKIAHRGIYTSGKGSSAVGLTASVVRDVETRDLVLESGALVLSDLGVCCIDEFDKMSDATRSVLHEAMEQQTVSIAKAGIIATLHARTSILASANPTSSRYNPNQSVVQNIQLPPTLLSRFDLIYLVLDSPNANHDRRLAQHLVGLYYETPSVVQPPLDQELLRDYIEYARTHIHPCLSEEASNEILSSYLQMRSMGGGGASRTIAATPRQLESMIRLSEALAKMRFSREVTKADAQEAVRLIRVATQAAATDPRTGRIDMDMIATGKSSLDRQAQESMTMQIKELLAHRRGSRMAVRDVVQQWMEITNNTSGDHHHDEVVDVLKRMEDDGVVQFNERAQTVFVRSGVF